MKIKDKNSKFRYERKFLIQNLSLNDVIHLINMNSSVFTNIYTKRRINNIYFDTINLKNYFENKEGDTYREKIRVRWYGEIFEKIKKPTLEIKIKNGLLGKKKSLKLSDFNIFNFQLFFNEIKKYSINEEFSIDTLIPIILNSYIRSYYISNDKNFRITIDSDQIYYKVNKNFNNYIDKVKDELSIVLEIKYNDENDDRINFITNNFPFRLTKNSKYVNAVNIIYQQ